jgi:hypothetical protein
VFAAVAAELGELGSDAEISDTMMPALRHMFAQLQAMQAGHN